MPGLSLGALPRVNVDEDPVASFGIIDSRQGGSDPYAYFHIYPDEIIKIGRHPRHNTFIVENNDIHVSSRHCEFYAITYDDQTQVSPLVYVRSRNETNGTILNEECIGRDQKVTAGRLLRSGDVVTLNEHLKLRFEQEGCAALDKHKLTAKQALEVKALSSRYEVTDRVLGEGNSTVYLAIKKPSDHKPSRQVVCKVHDLDKIGNASGSKQLHRFLQEVDILRQLDHPNILSYHDAFQSPHTLYTFVELAAGGDLFSFLLRSEHLEEREVKSIMRQVVHGVEYLHDMGVAHRDIKLENILLATRPDAEHRVVLADFGCSAISTHRQGRMKTKNIGTDIYWAPEQLSPSGKHGVEVDIWAVGLVALKLFAPAILVGELHAVSQGFVEAFVDSALVDNPHIKVSKHAVGFLKDCLRIAPARRITAKSAATHRWLRVEEKGDMLRRMEAYIQGEWKPRKGIPPMIESLPDVVDKHSPPRLRDVDLQKSPKIRSDPRVTVAESSIRRPGQVNGVLQLGIRDSPGVLGSGSKAASARKPQVSTSTPNPAVLSAQPQAMPATHGDATDFKSVEESTKAFDSLRAAKLTKKQQKPRRLSIQGTGPGLNSLPTPSAPTSSQGQPMSALQVTGIGTMQASSSSPTHREDTVLSPTGSNTSGRSEKHPESTQQHSHHVLPMAVKCVPKAKRRVNASDAAVLQSETAEISKQTTMGSVQDDTGADGGALTTSLQYIATDYRRKLRPRHRQAPLRSEAKPKHISKGYSRKGCASAKVTALAPQGKRTLAEMIEDLEESAGQAPEKTQGLQRKKRMISMMDVEA